jgi:gamma-glutamylcyclotransferase (GGCT)/AIG2-like uncharacterized protein YtfP
MSARVPLFTFGSLLDAETMLDRAPGAERVGPAVLDDWRLAFRRSVADIVPAPGRQVLGGLWAVTDEDLDALDRYEGIGSGSYSRYRLPVRTDEGEVWPWAYVMPPGRGDSEAPYGGYVTTVANGLRQWGHPTTELERAVGEARLPEHR